MAGTARCRHAGLRKVVGRTRAMCTLVRTNAKLAPSRTSHQCAAPDRGDSLLPGIAACGQLQLPLTGSTHQP
jgi:hypothetical protein